MKKILLARWYKSLSENAVEPTEQTNYEPMSSEPPKKARIDQSLSEKAVESKMGGSTKQISSEPTSSENVRIDSMSRSLIENIDESIKQIDSKPESRTDILGQSKTEPKPPKKEWKVVKKEKNLETDKMGMQEGMIQPLVLKLTKKRRRKKKLAKGETTVQSETKQDKIKLEEKKAAIDDMKRTDVSVEMVTAGTSKEDDPGSWKFSAEHESRGFRHSQEAHRTTSLAVSDSSERGNERDNLITVEPKKRGRKRKMDDQEKKHQPEPKKRKRPQKNKTLWEELHSLSLRRVTRSQTMELYGDGASGTMSKKQVYYHSGDCDDNDDETRDNYFQPLPTSGKVALEGPRRSTETKKNLKPFQIQTELPEEKHDGKLKKPNDYPLEVYSGGSAVPPDNLLRPQPSTSKFAQEEQRGSPVPGAKEAFFRVMNINKVPGSVLEREQRQLNNTEPDRAVDLSRINNSDIFQIQTEQPVEEPAKRTHRSINPSGKNAKQGENDGNFKKPDSCQLGGYYGRSVGPLDSILQLLLTTSKSAQKEPQRSHTPIDPTPNIWKVTKIDESILNTLKETESRLNLRPNEIKKQHLQSQTETIEKPTERAQRSINPTTKNVKRFENDGKFKKPVDCPLGGSYGKSTAPPDNILQPHPTTSKVAQKEPQRSHIPTDATPHVWNKTKVSESTSKGKQKMLKETESKQFLGPHEIKEKSLQSQTETMKKPTERAQRSINPTTKNVKRGENDGKFKKPVDCPQEGSYGKSAEPPDNILQPHTTTSKVAQNEPQRSHIPIDGTPHVWNITKVSESTLMGEQKTLKETESKKFLRPHEIKKKSLHSQTETMDKPTERAQRSINSATKNVRRGDNDGKFNRPVDCPLEGFYRRFTSPPVNIFQLYPTTSKVAQKIPIDATPHVWNITKFSESTLMGEQKTLKETESKIILRPSEIKKESLQSQTDTMEKPTERGQRSINPATKNIKRGENDGKFKKPVDCPLEGSYGRFITRPDNILKPHPTTSKVAQKEPQRSHIPIDATPHVSKVSDSTLKTLKETESKIILRPSELEFLEKESFQSQIETMEKPTERVQRSINPTTMHIKRGDNDGKFKKPVDCPLEGSYGGFTSPTVNILQPHTTTSKIAQKEPQRSHIPRDATPYVSKVSDSTLKTLKETESKIILRPSELEFLEKESFNSQIETMEKPTERVQRSINPTTMYVKRDDNDGKFKKPDDCPLEGSYGGFTSPPVNILQPHTTTSKIAQKEPQRSHIPIDATPYVSKVSDSTLKTLKETESKIILRPSELEFLEKESFHSQIETMEKPTERVQRSINPTTMYVKRGDNDGKFKKPVDCPLEGSYGGFTSPPVNILQPHTTTSKIAQKEPQRSHIPIDATPYVSKVSDSTLKTLKETESKIILRPSELEFLEKESFQSQIETMEKPTERVQRSINPTTMYVKPCDNDGKFKKPVDCPLEGSYGRFTSPPVNIFQSYPTTSKVALQKRRSTILHKNTNVRQGTEMMRRPITMTDLKGMRVTVVHNDGFHLIGRFVGMNSNEDFMFQDMFKKSNGMLPVVFVGSATLSREEIDYIQATVVISVNKSVNRSH